MVGACFWRSRVNRALTFLHAQGSFLTSLLLFYPPQFMSLVLRGFRVVGMVQGGDDAPTSGMRAWAAELDLEVAHPQAVIDRESPKTNI